MYTGPNIITDGLVLYLDAANTKSYTSGSTTWTDLSGNNINCTLNGVDYDNSNGGSFVWDNNLDKLQINGLLPNLTYTNATVCFWLKTTDTRFVILSRNGGSPYLGAVYVGGTANGLWYHAGIGSPTSYRNSNLSTGPIFDNTWNYYTFTNCDFSQNSGWTNGIITILYYPGGWEFNPGQLASFKIYNRALTAAEILQNYNATKSRFNL